MYTQREIRYCQARKHAIEHFAGRWAAKEAILKAMGTGWTPGHRLDRHRGPQPHPAARPRSLVCGAAKEIARERGIGEILVSISHCRTYAIAYAMALARKPQATPSSEPPAGTELFGPTVSRVSSGDRADSVVPTPL